MYSISQLQKRIASWQGLQDLLGAIRKNNYPHKIIGINNGFKGFFLHEFLKKTPSNLLFIVPTEREIDGLVSDISILGGACHVLPSWGTLPYKGFSSNATIFASRASVLCQLASTIENPNIDAQNIFKYSLISLSLGSISFVMLPSGFKSVKVLINSSF